MAKLTAADREARRDRILQAARDCVGRYGLEAVSMEMIIAASGLSTGAVYRHFTGKDEIIAAAVVAGTHVVLRALRPVLGQNPAPGLSELVGQVLGAIGGSVRSGPATAGRPALSLDGWSHAQADDRLAAAVRESYRGVRRSFRDLARTWTDGGSLPAGADPDAVAELLTSITLGFTAQQALVGDVDPERHERALAALVGGDRFADGPTGAPPAEATAERAQR